MNIILVHSEEIRADTVTLGDHRADHLRRILKSREGDVLRAGIIDGPMGSATVLRRRPREITLRLDCRQAPPAKAATALILALPRPIMLKRVLAQAASMGVDRIMLVNARRVEKSFFLSAQLSPDKIKAALLKGLEQAGDTRLPRVSVHPRFRPFIEDELSPPRDNGPRRLLAHPGDAIGHATGEATGYGIEQRPGHPAHRVAGPGETSHLPLAGDRQLLAIGPEGGWVEFELNCFQQQGFIPFSWGRRTLRVDTAVPVLLAMAEAGCPAPAGDAAAGGPAGSSPATQAPAGPDHKAGRH